MTELKVSFPATIRDRARSKSNPQGRELSIADLAKLCNVSYEHMRKIFRGTPAVSEELNVRLSEALGIPNEEMWNAIQVARLRKRFPSRLVSAAAQSRSSDQRLLPRHFLVRYHRVALVKAECKRSAVEVVTRSRAEAVTVDRVWRVEVDGTGNPLITPGLPVDEVLDPSVSPRVPLLLSHCEARLLAAALSAAEDKVGLAGLVRGWSPTRDELHSLTKRLGRAVTSTAGS